MSESIFNSAIKMQTFASEFANKVSKGDSIFLYGEIGTGKTTFARLLINNCELENKKKKSEVLSPTFNILFEYDINNLQIKHYDLYRLKDKKDVNNLGVFENSEQCVTLIEWPELIDKKPLNRIDIFFEYSDDMQKRFLNIKSTGRLKGYEF